MALDTAWPCANDTYRLCCLSAYFCAHKLARARPYVVVFQIGIAMGFLLQIRMSWLRALSKGCLCWCRCCGPACWFCELAERALVGCWRRCRCCQLANKSHRCWCQLVARAVEVLPSYLGLCWCFFPNVVGNHPCTPIAMGVDDARPSTSFILLFPNPSK